MSSSVQLTLTLGGERRVPLHVRWSTLALAAAVLVTMAIAALPQSAPGQSVAAYWLTAAPTAVLVVASLGIHEIGHALIAKRLGLRARLITLSSGGGTIEFETDSPTPRTEFLVSLAGPAANLALGGVSATTVALGGMLGMSVVLSVALVWLTILNILLAVLNLLPGATMDGGQMLMALLWHVTGDQSRATAVSARVGRTAGFALGAAGLTMIFAAGTFGGLWLLLPGLLLIGQRDKHAATTTSDSRTDHSGRSGARGPE